MQHEGGMMNSTLESPIGTMNIMDDSGHRQINWNMSNAKEIAAAQKTFDRMLRLGYVGFGAMNKSDPKEAIKTFDPTMKELVLVPRIVGG
jgi:hypothetical protein